MTMSEATRKCPGCKLNPEEVEAARPSGDAEAAGVLALSPPSGRPEKLLLVGDKAAGELAVLLGHFGGPLAVRMFAAVCLADLCEHDLALAVGGDSDEFRAELAHLLEDNFVYRFPSGGAEVIAAGNPALRRFFIKRFEPPRDASD